MHSVKHYCIVLNTMLPTVTDVLPRLEVAKGLTDQVHDVNERAREGLKDLLIGLSNLPQGTCQTLEGMVHV